ncbi:hypothetical protein VFPPC_13179 [Pochonia chlamydosporia 170]|uniref:Uncharacterized protein n=1 Tax=Pochonia chlamydosporia 170 TaxID=1380566 RepID=A0A179F704_METCM|nr:hypothetical protein VFPPC_13179 [Pochonia chlamydosporia 170]OAQ60879.1 hypothetical protein VFPPC_13179 [Pochonia chlamydosporia 170]
MSNTACGCEPTRTSGHGDGIGEALFTLGLLLEDLQLALGENEPVIVAERKGGPSFDLVSIVTALEYLENKGLRFGSLTCSDVLLHPSGRVKLCRQHHCTQSDSKDDIRRLDNVMMELVDGYVKDGANIGVDNPERWSLEALHFLGATTSASSAEELLQVCRLPLF